MLLTNIVFLLISHHNMINIELNHRNIDLIRTFLIVYDYYYKK